MDEHARQCGQRKTKYPRHWSGRATKGGGMASFLGRILRAGRSTLHITCDTPLCNLTDAFPCNVGARWDKFFFKHYEGVEDGEGVGKI